MKRIWFAIAFISIITLLCVGEQKYVAKVYNDLNDEIATSLSASNQKDLSNSINSIQKYWKDNNDILFAIADHGVLDDLSAEINSLDSNNEDVKSDLSEIKSLLKVFYENQRVTISNVF
jgi:hypothetical protein